MRPFFNAIGRHRFSFLSLPGVVSVGLGIKRVNNRHTGIPSLVFGVEKKMPPGEIPFDQLIPNNIDRLPTDVVEVGKIRFLGYALPGSESPPEDQTDFRKEAMRPAQPGVSIGHYKITAGTLGAVVRGRFPGGVAILSNNHILANSTNGSDGRARIGDPILQPGPYDGGGRNDIIARLQAYSPVIEANKDGSGPLNRIDAAIALPVAPDLVKSAILGLGNVIGTSSAVPGMLVYKSGRTTGVTSGPVASIGNTIQVEDENKNYVFENQIGINAKSEGGDSGSLIVNHFGKAVGLLFAGSKGITYANPIKGIADYFKISF